MKVFQITDPDDLDDLTTRLWDLETTGILEEGTALTAYFGDSADLSSLIETYGSQAVHEIEQAPAVPSHQKADESEPILAGAQFAIVSSLSHATRPANRTCIAIDAGNSFGSGRHESTQLVIAALEEYLRPDCVLMDVGSGSGIVSAVASHLGARLVIACDTHLDSTYLTRHHAPDAHVFAGSIDSIRSECFDVVVANISARIIDDLSIDLNRIVKVKGWLVFSGFVSERPPKHFSPIAEFTMNDWKCWICKPQLVSEEEKGHTSSLQPFATEWW